MIRRIRHIRRAQFRRPSDQELHEADRDNATGDAIPTKGFCHECEKFVDEAAGKLHRATCKGVTPERRMAS